MDAHEGFRTVPGLPKGYLNRYRYLCRNRPRFGLQAKLKEQGQHGSIPGIWLARKEKELKSAGTVKPSKSGTLAGLAGRESIQETLVKEDSGSSKQLRGRPVPCPSSLSPAE